MYILHHVYTQNDADGTDQVQIMQLMYSYAAHAPVAGFNSVTRGEVTTCVLIVGSDKVVARLKSL